MYYPMELCQKEAKHGRSPLALPPYLRQCSLSLFEGRVVCRGTGAKLALIISLEPLQGRDPELPTFVSPGMSLGTEQALRAYCLLSAQKIRRKKAFPL